MLLHHEGLMTIGDLVKNLALMGGAGVALGFRIGWQAIADTIKSAWYTIRRKDIGNGR